MDARVMYSGFLTTAVHTPLSALKVVLDTANGASYALAPAVFKRLGANVPPTPPETQVIEVAKAFKMMIASKIKRKSHLLSV